jgi:hypothetical protein
MSFRLNHPDDHPVPEELDQEFLEQELPADFAALGEQLGADAQRLASVYPACQPPLELIAALGGEAQRPSLARQMIGLASAAAGILLLLGLIGFALSPVWLAQPPADSPAVNPPTELVHQRAPNQLPELQPVSYRPALVDMNGPELEGLLDLWQEQPQPESTISF